MRKELISRFKKEYECPICGDISYSLNLAKDHMKIPIRGPIPVGTSFRYKRSYQDPNPRWFFVMSHDSSSLNYNHSHNQEFLVYYPKSRTFDDAQRCYNTDADSVREDLRKGEYVLLTPEEAAQLLNDYRKRSEAFCNALGKAFMTETTAKGLLKKILKTKIEI
jgi:hypothetical protein